MKERTLLELWLIVEANFERIYNSFFDQKGLCNVFHVLEQEGEINWREALTLKMIINAYRFKRINTLIPPMYIWNKDARKPRRLFIQKQILKEIRKPIFN